MLKPLLLLAFSCLCFTATAQEQDYKKSHITLGFGLAIPVGDFGNDDWNERDPPFANTGSLLSLGFSKGLGKHFGIGATLARRSNSFNSAEYLNYRQETNYSYVKASGTSWVSNFVLGDVYLKVPLKNATLYGKASLGTAFNTSAEYVLSSSFTHETTHEGKSKNMAYGLAGGAQFSAGRFVLDLEAGLLSTSPKFELENTYRDPNPRPDHSYTSSLEQDMKTFNISAKVSYSF